MQKLYIYQNKLFICITLYFFSLLEADETIVFLDILLLYFGLWRWDINFPFSTNTAISSTFPFCSIKKTVQWNFFLNTKCYDTSFLVVPQNRKTLSCVVTLEDSSTRKRLACSKRASAGSWLCRRLILTIDVIFISCIFKSRTSSEVESNCKLLSWKIFLLEVGVCSPQVPHWIIFSLFFLCIVWPTATGPISPITFYRVVLRSWGPDCKIY